MTGREGADRPPTPPPADQVETYRQAAIRPPIEEQLRGLAVDVANLTILSTADDPSSARGAALAVAHAALMLAVTPIAPEDEHRRRRQSDVLRATVMPVLIRAGLDHVVELIEAALAQESHPAMVGRAVGRPQ